MENKTNLIIIIILSFIFIISCMGYAYFFNNNQIDIGDVVFNLPEGYHQSKSAHQNEINITNGFNSMIISKIDGNNISKEINDYKQFKEDNNYSTEISNFAVKNISVYKVNIVNNTDIIHYWFEYENSIYTIYTWDANENNDEVIINLISSLSSK